MKKVLFPLALMFMMLMNVDAQDVQLATLQKAEGLQVFYGADAFKEAMAAADHGDVITLTSGSFNATTITKAVSIYGAGYEMDAKMKTSETGEVVAEADNELPKYPTRLVGNFSITLDLINEQPAEGLYMEGIYSNNEVFVGSKLVAASFVKCRFQGFSFWKDERTMMDSKDCLLSQCRIAGWLEPGSSQSMTMNNCIINLLGRNLDKSTCYVKNSIIYNVLSTWRGSLKDCIIGIVYNAGGNGFHQMSNVLAPLHSSSAAYHTLFNSEGALNNIITKDGNWLLTDIQWTTTLFGEEHTGYDDTFMYELTDAAKATYIGTDGKFVGIYGGTSPFSPTLTIPRVVKKDIAAETVDGKLKVNIKVETGDTSL